CPVCETKLEETGFGTEKVMEQLKKMFGGEVSYLEEGKNRINITATVVGKGFYAGRYDFVINLSPDYHLFLPDLRGEENFFRAVAFPYLKARREYLLFTDQDRESLPIKALLLKKPEVFYRAELESRKKAGLPPFGRLILLTFEKKNLTVETVENLFNRWLEELEEKPDYEGPFYAFLSKMRDRERVQVILKNFDRREELVRLFNLSSKKGIKLIIDIDPKQIR
ncbi:MAG: hypothetical protein GXN94_00075, partial [Aquificae bacterium]|nr:hypothetical protein [Aquificota bacterium]